MNDSRRCLSWKVIVTEYGRVFLFRAKWSLFRAVFFIRLINFTVTRIGLEDQLLGAVVRTERPDLEQLKSDLTKQQNDFKITLKRLEDGLLRQLSAAEGNFLGNVALVESLELNKRTAIEIEAKVAEAAVTEQNINTARETYRPAAARASLLYFILNEMNKASLSTFLTSFNQSHVYFHSPPPF